METRTRSVPEPPNYSETTHVVADALVEMREDSRCTHPDERTDEDTFIKGAILLMMEDRYVPMGPALAYMSTVIKRLADHQETDHRCRTRPTQ